MFAILLLNLDCVNKHYRNERQRFRVMESVPLRYYKTCPYMPGGGLCQQVVSGDVNGNVHSLSVLLGPINSKYHFTFHLSPKTHFNPCRSKY